MFRKKTAHKIFDSEKYRMNFCHECHGLGKTFDKDGSFNEDNSKEVCQVCGGGRINQKTGERL